MQALPQFYMILTVSQYNNALFTIQSLTCLTRVACARDWQVGSSIELNQELNWGMIAAVLGTVCAARGEHSEEQGTNGRPQPRLPHR